MDVLITGSTGMVGKSVLQECINDKRVKNIYLINRLPVNLKSPKISEFIITDFLKVGEVKKNIKSYDKFNRRRRYSFYRYERIRRYWI